MNEIYWQKKARLRQRVKGLSDLGEKILIVDDSLTILEVLKSVLIEENFRVISALDGVSGLELALQEKPDLIILDMMLPGMNGDEVCKRIKSDDEAKNIPVVIITAKPDLIDDAQKIKMGADDYIYKPIDPSLLVRTIRQILIRRGKNAPGESLSS